MNKRSDYLLKKPVFGNEIGRFVHAYFDRKLPNNKGKPRFGSEWTILAAVVVEKELENTLDIRPDVS